MAAPLAIDKEAVKLALVAGVPYNSVALSHGMVDEFGRPDTNTLRQWVKRYNWPVPTRIRELAKQRVKEAQEQGIPVNTEDVTLASRGVKNDSFSGQKATVTASNDLLRNGQRGTLLAQQALVRSLEQLAAIEGTVPLASAGDVVTALKGVRLAAGMDTQDSTRLSISLLGGNASLPDVESIDVEVVSRDDVTDDEVGD